MITVERDAATATANAAITGTLKLIAAPPKFLIIHNIYCQLNMSLYLLECRVALYRSRRSSQITTTRWRICHSKGLFFPSDVRWNLVAESRGVRHVKRGECSFLLSRLRGTKLKEIRFRLYRTSCSSAWRQLEGNLLGKEERKTQFFIISPRDARLTSRLLSRDKHPNI